MFVFKTAMNISYGWMSVIAQQDATIYSLLHFCKLLCIFGVMGEGTTRNMYSSLQKYNKLYIVASCWTVTSIDSKSTDP